MKRKMIWAAASGLIVLWVLTLDIFHRRRTTAEFHVASGNAREAFELGTELFYPNTWIGARHHHTLGIPYLIHSVADCPPYDLSFCFTANVEQQVNSLTIESIVIDYDSGHVDSLGAKRLPETSEFRLDERGRSLGQTPYLRANFDFNRVLTREDSFWATISGSYVKGAASLPYKTRVRVNIRRETRWSPGWFQLLPQGD